MLLYNYRKGNKIKTNREGDRNMTKINGYDVKHCYAGIDQYTVCKDGKEIGTCYDISTVARWTETDPETVKEEMWKQR